MRQLLQASCSYHNKRTLAAVAGCGVDRHMLGLRMTTATHGLAMHSVFGHSAFALPWSLSTSAPPIMQEYHGAKAQLYPLVKHSAGGGFGPVAVPGVGVSYFVEDGRVHAFVTAAGAVPDSGSGSGSGSELDAAVRFATLLSEALGNMAALFE